VANDFGVLKFTATANHAANVLPVQWNGREVGITATGGVVHFGFSLSESAEIDAGATATAAGESDKVGMPVPDSLASITRARVPLAYGQPVYFVREATADTTVYMQLLD
jgi:hypothetical protein